MPLANSTARFGSVARTFHWLTALLVLTAIPLGLYAHQLPYDTDAALAWKAQVFSVHKTVGVTAFGVALLRILWALGQPRPAALHPDRRWETRLADLTHWILYVSLLAVPLSGWIHHAAADGFAPILWPIGQDLPFVPKSAYLAQVAGVSHWIFTKLLGLAILFHVAGALKHHLIDRDATLRRMWRGTEAAPARPAPRHGLAPAAIAVALYAAGAGIAFALVPRPEAAAAADAAPAAADTGGNWQVAEGTLGFTVRQMGADVAGSFATWSAEITFEETPAADGSHGAVTVMIDTTTLTLGSVTEQAKAAEFFDTAAHPTATFAARILPDGANYKAEGTLALRGATVPVTLPFTLAIDGETARMTGQVTLDRRDFGMGPSYPDEKSVGFSVAVDVALTATRRD